MTDHTPQPQGTVAGLADAVKALRAELSEAMEAGQGQPLQFEVGAVKMDFAVELSADAQAKGGVRFWVVELGASGSIQRKGVHTVTIEMKPRARGGRRALIADENLRYYSEGHLNPNRTRRWKTNASSPCRSPAHRHVSEVL